MLVQNPDPGVRIWVVEKKSDILSLFLFSDASHALPSNSFQQQFLHFTGTGNYFVVNLDWLASNSAQNVLRDMHTVHV